jgi:hypothetical protein
MSVDARQRWSRERRCRVCGGHPLAERHQARRCCGYLSSDGRFGRCSREEHAGQLVAGPDGLFPHYLAGPCRCGVTHGEGLPLDIRDTPAPRPIGNPMAAVAAPYVWPVARWLREDRRLSLREIADLRAVEWTAGGPAVAFSYFLPDGKLQALKVRPIGCKEQMFRSPAGAGHLGLYLGQHLGLLADDEVIVTEGELDAHALRSVGINHVVSVPDGARTRLTPALLAPLARFRRVGLAIDVDEEGGALAQRLVKALRPRQCQRVRFGCHKDAGDALRAGWEPADFERSLSLAWQEAA